MLLGYRDTSFFLLQHCVYISSTEEPHATAFSRGTLDKLRYHTMIKLQSTPTKLRRTCRDDKGGAGSYSEIQKKEPEVADTNARSL